MFKGTASCSIQNELKSFLNVTGVHNVIVRWGVSVAGVGLYYQLGHVFRIRLSKRLCVSMNVASICNFCEPRLCI